MPQTMTQERREALLKQVDRLSPAHANRLNGVENAGQLVRLAIMGAGLSQKEAQDALGVEDKGQFSRMLDGKESLGVHRLLRPEAVTIWRELMALTARRAGYAVERVIRWEESA
jgi:hypothetical protein